MWALAKYIVDNAVKGAEKMLGNADQTGGSISEGNVMAKLNAAIANTDENSLSDKSGSLSQKHAYTHSLLENSSFGLNALINKLDNPKVVKSVQRGVTASATNPDYLKITVSISAVNPAKCFVLLTSEYYAYSIVPYQGYYSEPVVDSFSSTSIVLKPGRWPHINTDYANNRSLAIRWQIIEFY